MAGFKVMARRCDQCLYDPNNRIVPAKRAAQIMKECTRKDNNFRCHKGTILGEDVMCAGDIDSRGYGQMARIAGRLGMIERVDPDDYTKRIAERDAPLPPSGKGAAHDSER